MEYLSSTIYIIGPLGVVAMLLLFMTMGKRLGEALELPPYYRLYFLAIFFFFLPLPLAWVSLLVKAWGLPNPEPQTGLIIKIMVASLPMTIAITFAVFATAKYWNWIWGELRRSRKGGGEKDAT
jgi:hypothetical protein